MCVFSSSAGLCVRALLVKKGIRACPNLLLNSYPAYYRSPISPHTGGDQKTNGEGGKKGGQFSPFDGGERQTDPEPLAGGRNKKKRFRSFVLREKKVVFCVFRETHFCRGENTPKAFDDDEENAERTREREREPWKKGSCRREEEEEEEEEIRAFFVRFF